MVGQLGQDLSRHAALDESVEHLAPVAPEDIHEHSPEAQPFAVYGLVDALPQAQPVIYQLAAVAARPAQFGEVPVRQEADLAYAGQPHAVRHVGLPPFELAHIPRVDHAGADSGVFQDPAGLLPVDAGALLGGHLHVVLG